MLYNMPNSRGKRRIGNVKILSKIPRASERKKDSATDNLKRNSILFMALALSGVFIESSFKSVNLFNPYVLNVVKKVIITMLKVKT